MAEVSKAIKDGFEDVSAPFYPALLKKLERQEEYLSRMVAIQDGTMQGIHTIANNVSKVQNKFQDSPSKFDNNQNFKGLIDLTKKQDQNAQDNSDAVNEAIMKMGGKVDEQINLDKKNTEIVLDKMQEQMEQEVTLTEQLGKKFDGVARSFKKGLTSPLAGAFQVGFASLGLGGLDETFKASEKIAGVITSFGEGNDSEKANLMKEGEILDKKADKLKKDEIELEKAKKEEGKKVSIWTRLMRLYQKTILIKNIKKLGQHFKKFSEITEKHFEKSRQHQLKAFSCLCDGSEKKGLKDKVKDRQKPDKERRSLADYLKRTESPKKDKLSEARGKRAATLKEKLKTQREARLKKPKKPSMMLKLLKMLAGAAISLVTMLPGLGTGIAAAVGGAMVTLGGVLTGAVTGLGASIKAFGAKAFDVVTGAAKKVGGALKTGFTKGKDLIKKGAGGLGKLLGGAGKLASKVGGKALTGVTAVYGFSKGLGETEKILGLGEGEEFGTADIIQGGVAKGIESVASPFAWIADKATGGKFKLQEKVSAQNISKNIDIGRSAAGVERKSPMMNPTIKVNKGTTSAKDYKGSGKGVAPIDKMLVTSPFGMRIHPIQKVRKMHSGVDIGAWNGTPIKAPYDGEVLYSGQRGTFGNFVWLKHAGGLETSYAHMSSINVAKGDKVEAGAVIGKVGNTGASAGDHLHWQATLNGKYFDPMGLVGTSVPVKDTGMEMGLQAKEKEKPAPKITAAPMNIADVGVKAPDMTPAAPATVGQEPTQSVTVSQTAEKSVAMPKPVETIPRKAEQVPAPVAPMVAAGMPAAGVPARGQSQRTSSPMNASPANVAGRRVGIDDPMLALIQVLL
jgi:murein DD-endopeptidase MepM/ murein hydrolase activator NlpD